MDHFHKLAMMRLTLISIVNPQKFFLIMQLYNTILCIIYITIKLQKKLVNTNARVISLNLFYCFIKSHENTLLWGFSFAI